MGLTIRSQNKDFFKLKPYFTSIYISSNPIREPFSGVLGIRQWKNECYVLTLRFFSVPDQGAYVINF